MEEYIQNYLKEVKQKNKVTYSAYCYDLKQFASCFTDGNIPEKKEELHDYVKKLKADYSDATVKRKLSSVSTFYRYLIKEGIVDDNPVTGIVVIRDSQKMCSITDQDIERFFLRIQKEMKKDKLGSAAKDMAIAALFLYTGIRLIELCNLKTTDVTKSSISVGEGRSRRDIPVSEELKKYLGSYNRLMRERGLEQRTWYFVNVRGNQLNYSAVQKRMAKYNQGENSISPSTLRHAFARNFMKTENDIYRLQYYLGLRSGVRVTEQFAGILQEKPET